jgi:NodT family efflux transporter outer membrane factor (OMF) lipoprotein
MKKTPLIFFCFLGLFGCKVGPNYQEPTLSMPAVFEGQGEKLQDEELCHWWKGFNDPLLNSFVEEAALLNFDVRIAVEKIVQARALYRIQGSYLWPEIDLNVSATRSRFSENVFTTGTNIESVASGNESGATRGAFGQDPVQSLFQVGFDAIWELDFWGKFRRDKQASYDEWQATGWQAQEVLLLTISEVIRNYISIRSLQEQIEIVKKKIEIDARGLYLAEDLFSSGLENDSFVEQWKALLERDLSVISPLKAACAQSIYALAILLGKEPEGFSAVLEEIKPIPLYVGKVPGGVPSELLRRRPDIRMQERLLAAATERIGVAVADLFPHIFLTGNGIGYESNEQNNWLASASRYWTIGPSINWNILNFGRVKGQIGAANSLQRQALLQYEQAVISALQDVEGALVSYFEEEKRNTHLYAQKMSYQRTWILTKDLWNAGLSSELKMLQTYADLLDSETSFVQSIEAKMGDLVALYKAAGGDWECLSTR